MALKIRVLCLFILAVNWISVDAGNTLTSETTVAPTELKGFGSEIIVPEAAGKSGQVCTLCEQFVAETKSFLSDNKTQTEIVGTLHKACSMLQSLEEKCIVLVDYYTSMLFLEISTVHPEEFCHAMYLCEKKYVALNWRNDTCNFCQQVVVEIVTKLKDPDTQLEIIEMLLKECNNMGDYAKECKGLVFHYGPLILVNTEKFLEKMDFCSAIRACSSSKAEAVGAAQIAETLLADA